jgi:hypothetical protein
MYCVLLYSLYTCTVFLLVQSAHLYSLYTCTVCTLVQSVHLYSLYTCTVCTLVQSVQSFYLYSLHNCTVCTFVQSATVSNSCKVQLFCKAVQHSCSVQSLMFRFAVFFIQSSSLFKMNCGMRTKQEIELLPHGDKGATSCNICQS